MSQPTVRRPAHAPQAAHSAPASAQAMALYQQVKDYIARRIQEGVWRAGDRLPSENDLVTQDGTNNRTRATEMAAASAIATESAAAQRRLGAEAEAQAIRVVGQATGEAERAKYEASVGIDPAILTALALRELAANMPAIDSLTITPDLLAPVLSRLAATPAAPAPVAR